MHGMLKSMIDGETKKHVHIDRIAAIKQAAGVSSPSVAAPAPMTKISAKPSPPASTSCPSMQNFASPGAVVWNRP
jgi:hypothetical protein